MPKNQKPKSNSGQLIELAFKKVFTAEELGRLLANGGQAELLFKVGCERNPGKVQTQLLVEVA